MSPNLTLALVAGALVAAGVYLILERSLTRILIGVLLASNGVNVLFLVASGAAGGAPITGVTQPQDMSDPLPQAFVLTAIVITLAVTAFLLALAYRSFQIAGHDEVSDDVEDAAIRRLAVDDETSGSDDPDVEGHPDETGQATGEEEGERVTADPEASDADPVGFEEGGSAEAEASEPAHAAEAREVPAGYPVSRVHGGDRP
ncbi:MAG: Na(+)/H(+) antiporter subunit C [Janthinobacterium lividum]